MLHRGCRQVDGYGMGWGIDYRAPCGANDIQTQNKYYRTTEQILYKYLTNTIQTLYKYWTKTRQKTNGTHQGVSQLWVRVRARTPSLWKVKNWTTKYDKMNFLYKRHSEIWSWNITWKVRRTPKEVPMLWPDSTWMILNFG